MNLDDISPDLLMARGEYATVRSAHEDEKKRLSILCGELSSTASQVLRYMQPANDDTPELSGAVGALSYALETLGKIEQCVSVIEELADQRAELKGKAWPKTPR